MPTETEVLNQIRQQVEAQGRNFSELPEIELDIRGNVVFPESGFARNAAGQVIGLRLSLVQLSDYAVLKIFRQLTSLSLISNTLLEIGFVADLTALTQLDLRGNQISDLTPLDGLTTLTRLWLSGNQINNLIPLSSLTALTQLDLGDYLLRGNQICDLTPLAGLTALTRLDLARNEISDLTPLAGLTALTGLDLSRNQIRDLRPLASLIQNSNLKIYYLDSQKPKKIIRRVVRRPCETPPVEIIEQGRTAIKDNPFETPPVEIVEQGRTAIKDNPFETPPVEIVEQGREAVLEWFKASAEGEHRPLNEVKVLLVGDGGAGKTSLVKRLFKKDFDPHEAQTHGILISQGNLTVNGAKTRLRFWDFGGQEIYHATHQFFLSQRSLYILVLDGRKDEKTEYWLKLIRSFGGDSPVLVVLNKIDEHPNFEVNRNDLREKYPAIQGFYRLSCKTGEGCVAFQKGLRQALGEVELLRSTWPETWFRVKTRLETMRDHFIGYPEYRTICCKAQVTAESAQDTLLTFLHDLGVILHFPDYELLDTHVLEPAWVTEAVYRIINSPQVAVGRGVFALADLPQILEVASTSPYRYPHEKHGFLIQLMKKFELCYVLDPHPQHILIPQMLPVPEPEFAFEDAGALRFRIEYDFLPRSIMPRFIVRRHRDIKADLRWRSGVVLEDTDLQATAVVRSDDEARTITIRVSGAQRRDYFQILLKTLRELHADFQQLGEKELVPCNCRECAASAAPWYYDYGYLLKLQRNRRPTVNCQRSTEDVPIANLMEGIEIMNPAAVYEWDVFLSYATQDSSILKRIVRDLQAAQIRYWWDQEQIKPGDNIIGQIERGLQRSRLFLLCFSRNQLNSGWSRAEYQTLLNEIISGRTRQKFIPLVLDDLAPEDLPLLCRSLRHERYHDRAGYQRVLDLLRLC